MILEQGWPSTIKRTGARREIYDGPVVKLITSSDGPFAPCQPIIVDRYGDMLIAPSDFLRVKRLQSKRKSWESTYQYARMLADILFVLQSAKGGAGVPYWSVNDDILRRFSILFTGPKFLNGKPTGNRGIANATWNTRLSLLLQFLLHCERKGWARGLIGVSVENSAFRVNLTRADPYPVHELEMQEFEPDEVIIPQDEAIKAVRIGLEEIVQSRLVRQRNKLLFCVMDENLRRKEASNLPISAIPSAEHLKSLRLKAQSTGILQTVPIRVHGAKTDQERMVPFPLILVENLREFIDDYRDKFGPARGEKAIFLSLKGGKRLHPQSITNLMTLARKKAISTASADGADAFQLADIQRFHAHILRHRRVTDGLANALEAGLDPIHAMTDMMASAGMSFHTMLGYLHLSQDRRESVRAKRGVVNQLREEEVEKNLSVLDISRLNALSPRRSPRKKRRR